MAPVYADHPFSLIPTPIFAKGKDAETDMFDEIASEMALVHNLLILGLNSIYLQAPHIKPADEKPFCSHHAGEEAMFFPAVEKMAGVKGLMDANVDQHKTFHDGVDSLKAYAGAVVSGKEKYDGSRVTTLIDLFGNPMMQHLADEIPSILNLRQYGDKMADLPKLFEEEAGQAMKELGMSGLVWCFANLNVHYENDLWPSFPPAPGPVKALVRSVFWWIHADSRKFGAVDRTGSLRHLYAVPASS
ncbi:hypothetical protein C8A00DRAFT_42718 [Chaetomidium leptoderma]|uniref:Hemerythrin-like domain-containing protein n=1 Tax=Chaetomidium leptoderma TaxID=669021 RepID=A0AAN6ZY40_9PEZI|nr:hypothetical protein C8A00DRAFT_42718 [Chaetomidium leptoderma]